MARETTPRGRDAASRNAGTSPRESGPSASAREGATGGDAHGRASDWVVGIDLGPTNCVLAAADTRTEQATIDVLAIPQVVAPKQVEARELLPSFLYLAGTDEVGSLDLPWATGRDTAVG